MTANHAGRGGDYRAKIFFSTAARRNCGVVSNKQLTTSFLSTVSLHSFKRKAVQSTLKSTSALVSLYEAHNSLSHSGFLSLSLLLVF